MITDVVRVACARGRATMPEYDDTERGWLEGRDSRTAQERRDEMTTDPELDDRWEWIEVRRLCDEQPTYTRGRCLHREVVPVESAVDHGTVVARLCLTCDAQLPAGGDS